MNDCTFLHPLPAFADEEKDEEDSEPKEDHAKYGHREDNDEWRVIRCMCRHEGWD